MEHARRNAIVCGSYSIT